MIRIPQTLVRPAVPLDELSPPITSLRVLLQQCTQKSLALFGSLDVAAASKDSKDFMHTEFVMYVCVCVCVYIHIDTYMHVS